MSSAEYYTKAINELGKGADWKAAYDYFSDKDKAWHGQESLDKVNNAYQDFKDQYKNGKIPFNSLTYDSIKDFADDHNMTDAERLYFTERIAYDDPEFKSNTKLAYIGTFPELKNETFCDRYAAYVTKLYTGNEDLMPKGTWGANNAIEYYQKQGYTPRDISSAADMQDLTNQGILVYATGSGHVAIVSPGDVYESPSTGNIYPAVAQAGANQYLYNVTQHGHMDYSWTINDYENVIFYVK